MHRTARPRGVDASTRVVYLLSASRDGADFARDKAERPRVNDKSGVNCLGRLEDAHSQRGDRSGGRH